MGVSTDGIIAFGFQVGDEDETPAFLENVEDHDFEEVQARDLGLEKPTTTNYDDPVWSAYWKAKRERIPAEHPADLVHHCSGEYPMYFLAVPGTEVKANRGYPKAFSLPVITDEQINALRLWCEKHGVEWQEPKWHLMSYWG